MSLSREFAGELLDKEMRDAFLSAQLRTRIAAQIKTLRRDRGLSQGELGVLLNKPQSVVSRLEKRGGAGLSLQTLLEVASAFNVGLIVDLVPYVKFLALTSDLSPDAIKAEPFTPESLEEVIEDGASRPAKRAAPRRQPRSDGRSLSSSGRADIRRYGDEREDGGQNDNSPSHILRFDNRMATA